MKRFLASDVIYEDSFKGPAEEALQKDDITGVEVPPLQPFLPNAALASPEGAKALLPDLQRRTAASSGGDDAAAGNLRGTSLESTVAPPSETRLTPGQTASRPGHRAPQVAASPSRTAATSTRPNVVVTRLVLLPGDAQRRGRPARSPIHVDRPRRDRRRSRSPGPASDKIVFGDQGTLVIEVVAGDR